MTPSPPTQFSTSLSAHLQARRSELERATLTRVCAISEPGAADDPAYAEGLRTAVSAALDYGLCAVESVACNQPIPVTLLAQARLAARNRVSLETVLRRYFAGHTLLTDFIIQAAKGDDSSTGDELQRLLRAQGTLFDRLVVAVTEEYSRESESLLSSAERRRAERVQRLLAGEPLETAELGYDFEASHLGAVASGPGAAGAMRSLAKATDRRLLLVSRGEGAVWAWLGGRRHADLEQLERIVSNRWPSQISLAVGEPASGLAGWRFSHRQAMAALPVALRSSQPMTRYADSALLASMLQDDILATSLRQIYLDPLTAERDGGAALRESLRAYLAADRNASSAAAALGLSRHTVTSRLRAVEERLGRPLDSCTAEIAAALRLEELDCPVLPHVSFSRG